MATKKKYLVYVIEFINSLLLVFDLFITQAKGKSTNS